MKFKLLSLLIILGLILPMVASARCGTECRIKRRWNNFLGYITVPGTPVPPWPPSIAWPFGGTILYTFPCPCNAGVAIVILPAYGSAGPYFVPLTAIKSYFAVVPANLIMGGAIPGGYCGSPLICLPLPTEFTVLPQTGVGTSLVPPLVPPLPRI